MQGAKKLNGKLVKLAEMARKLGGVKERMHQAVLDAQKWRELSGVASGAEGVGERLQLGEEVVGF